MQLTVQGFGKTEYEIEVGEDDTTETMRQKVASAAGLAEDSFHMGFGGKDEGEDITELSAGDTIILTKTQKYGAIAELHALGVTDITAEKWGSVMDPEVACLLLQAEVATVIPNGFLWGESLTSLDLSAVSVVTQIGNGFLSESDVTSVDLSGLSSVTHIGSEFFCECMSLTELDLSSLSKLTKIEKGFLYNCGNLTALNLPPLNRVTEISRHFLAKCQALKTLHLPSLSSATYIGDYFLSDCNALATLDLTPLSSVTYIDIEFLANSGITALDLTPLSGVTRISGGGEYFLQNCTNLTALDVPRNTVVWSTVKQGKLSHLLVEPGARDESPEQRKRMRRAQLTESDDGDVSS